MQFIIIIQLINSKKNVAFCASRVADFRPNELCMFLIVSYDVEQDPKMLPCSVFFLRLPLANCSLSRYYDARTVHCQIYCALLN